MGWWKSWQTNEFEKFMSNEFIEQMAWLLGHHAATVRGEQDPAAAAEKQVQQFRRRYPILATDQKQAAQELAREVLRDEAETAN